ncbi:hypothetical protein QFZ77_007456 [Paenibacillus sp. V4I3]|nr:hypothetical protein [Paenibacillus sp. V4I3]MDQ0885351.1 hypothetical protein [Paenibacillus sp. V4I9]
MLFGRNNTLSIRKQMMLKHKEKVEKNLRQTYVYLEQIHYKLAFYDLQEKELNMLP